jgi:ATP-binding protein involved in chromosome partitioning
LTISAKIYLANTQSPRKADKSKKNIAGVKKVIIVCSGKGGVGKSTVSANIAYYLHLAGYKVGLFDADIYGPSIHRIFKVTAEVQVREGRFVPNEKYGIKLMSIGFIVPSEDALVWRGPMVTKTLSNMLNCTDWQHKGLMRKSDLDYLIIDTPPGTGDVHLSLAERYHIDGAVIVSSPQKLALANAHRSVDMLRKLKVKILGIVENMSYVINPDGSKNFVFGTSNTSEYATKNHLQLLAKIPIISEIAKEDDLDKIRKQDEFRILGEFIVETV